MNDIGHNSKASEDGHLKAYIERIERLDEEKRTITEDIKEVYAEAKGTGYDITIMRKIVAIRRQDSGKRREEEEMLELYMSQLGMLADTPLGQSALARRGA